MKDLFKLESIHPVFKDDEKSLIITSNPETKDQLTTLINENSLKNLKELDLSYRMTFKNVPDEKQNCWKVQNLSVPKENNIMYFEYKEGQNFIEAFEKVVEMEFIYRFCNNSKLQAHITMNGNTPKD